MSVVAADLAHLEAAVALRDGSVAHIRPVRAEDEPRLLTFLEDALMQDILIAGVRCIAICTLLADTPRLQRSAP